MVLDNCSFYLITEILDKVEIWGLCRPLKQSRHAGMLLEAFSNDTCLVSWCMIMLKNMSIQVWINSSHGEVNFVSTRLFDHFPAERLQSKKKTKYGIHFTLSYRLQVFSAIHIYSLHTAVCSH